VAITLAAAAILWHDGARHRSGFFATSKLNRLGITTISIAFENPRN